MEGIVAIKPIPSTEQIIQLYEAASLAVELAEYHLLAGHDDMLQARCMDLHNNGDREARGA